MKYSIKKLFSAVLAMIMVLSAVPFMFSASAAEPADPVFEVKIVSETKTEIVVSLNLVSGSFNCADFGFVAKAGYTGKSITPSEAVASSGSLYNSNTRTMQVSFVNLNTFSSKGAFFTAKYAKNVEGTAYKNGDISVSFSNCAISTDAGTSVELNPIVKNDFELAITCKGVEVDKIAAIKIGLFKSYKKATADLGISTDIDYARAEWSSSNSQKVKIDANGHITNSKLGSRNSDITLKLFDANGNLIAQKSVRVIFYKFSFQLNKLK